MKCYLGLGLNAGFDFDGWLLCVFVFVLNPNHTSWAPGPSDRDRLRAMETKSSKLCPKREGERDLSLGLGNVALLTANISPKGGRGAEILGSGIFPS